MPPQRFLLKIKCKILQFGTLGDYTMSFLEWILSPKYEINMKVLNESQFIFFIVALGQEKFV